MKTIRLYINLILSTCFLLLIISSCKEETVGQMSVDDVSPSSIQNVQIEPIPGGAKITYDLPKETDISYVVCEYKVNGEVKVTRASIYNNFLTIEGLPDDQTCYFSIYIVDHSDNRSAPFEGNFVPLEAPYKTIFKSLTTEPDFGGITVKWKNETRAVIGVFLLAMNDSNTWEEYELSFSTLENDKRSIRGYPAEPRWFGVVLMDKFGNYSDTLKVQATPLYERMLDKSKFTDGHLQGDNNTSYLNRPLSKIWDNNYNDNGIWHTIPTAGFTPPLTFTIDLGVYAKLSRMILYNRGHTFYYAQHNPRYFEVWASDSLSHDYNDTFWSVGDWRKEWIRLGDFEVVKPSGLPMGQNTSEDIAASDAGFEFIFESGVKKVRYVRFVVKETWAKTAALHIREVDIFGDDESNE